MVFSREREGELIEQNMPKIYRAIDNFMARRNGSSCIQLSYDDCVQEVSIVFLLHIRRCETEDQINQFPWYDAIHALSMLVLKHQPVSCRKDTKGFLHVIHNMPATVPFEVMMSQGLEVDGMSKHWVPDTDTKLDFDAFMSSQHESIQRIASMRLYGMTQRAIAAEYGVCQKSIFNKIAKLREDYNEFIKEDEDDD